MAVSATESEVWEALREVEDPEIPGLSVVDLGIVDRVRVDEGEIEVDITPTFTGCPAVEMMRREIELELSRLAERVRVRVTFERAWTSDRITKAGREHLRRSGLTPPPREGSIELQVRAKCPYCGSHDTRIENAFGPTLCRSIHYCNACHQPFEAFKPV